jgi:hypothetical protein
VIGDDDRAVGGRHARDVVSGELNAVDMQRASMNNCVGNMFTSPSSYLVASLTVTILH